MTSKSGRPPAKTNTSRAQIGVLGDDARVYGGIHFYTSPTRSLDLLPFNLGTNIRNFLLNYLGTASHPVPFGGRQDALEQLEQWRVQSDKRFLLLATPAGRGKSALLSRWAEQLSQPEPSETVAVVFVPISSRFNTNLPELVLACIAVQLALLLGEDVPSVYMNMPPGFWQSLVGEYLRRPLPDGRQLLLIVDGLDEAAWEVDPALFPQDLPETTQVVVSTRYLAGDLPGPGRWLGRLGWERPRLAEAMALNTLTREGMRDVLANIGRPLDTLLDREDVIDQLYTLTLGDPLLVKLYVDWLYEQRKSSVQLQPEDLPKIAPDYHGFFNYWWDAQERLWSQTGQADPLEKRAVRALLSILATALGPLSTSDVRALMPAELSPNKLTIRQALRPLRRFVIGDGKEVGLSFAHPRLADYFREEFLDDDEQRAWRAAFVRWGLVSIGREQASDEAQSRISPYLLQYLSPHLALAGEPVDSFLRLLSFEWMTGWHRNAGTYTGFLRDVNAVLERLVDVDRQALAQGLPAPYIGREIQCALCHASVVALSGNMPTELLVALRQYGSWTDEQVLAYARQKPDPYVRVQALVGLAPYLSPALQQETYQRVLQAVLALPYESERTNILRVLAPHLPEAVYHAAMALRNKWYRTHVLSAVAPHLPEVVYRAALRLSEEEERAKVLLAVAPHLPEAVQQALQAALALSDEWARASVLSGLILHLPEAERAEALRQALQATLALSDEWARASMLSKLALYLPEAVYQAALALQDERTRMSVLCALVPYLPEADRVEALQQALGATSAMRDERTRASVLSDLAPHLPEAVYQAALASQDEWARAEVLRGLASHLPEAVYQAALALQDEWARAEVLRSLVSHLPQAVYQATRAMRDEGRRAIVLPASVPHLPELGRAEALRQALQAALALGDEEAQTDILGALASHLPEAERTEVFQRAFQAAVGLPEEEKRAKVLLALAPHLPEEEQDEALQQALRAAQTLPDEGRRPWVLSILAPCLPEAQRDEVLQQTLRAAQALLDEGAQASVLSELAPPLPEAAYQAAMTLQREWEQARVLGAVAPHLPEAVYQAALALQNKGERASLLCAVAPHLPEVERAEALQQALQAALAEADEGRRAWMLSKLAPHLPEAVYQAALSLRDGEERSWVLRDLAPHMPEVVYEATQSLVDEHKLRVIGALTPYLVTLPLEGLYTLWVTVLPALNEQPRSEVLEVLAKLVPVIRALGGDAALSQTLQAVEEVCRWWP